MFRCLTCHPKLISELILAFLSVASFWAVFSFLLLFAYPTPELPTPSFEYHTAFNGVALGIVSILLLSSTFYSKWYLFVCLFPSHYFRFNFHVAFGKTFEPYLIFKPKIITRVGHHCPLGSGVSFLCIVYFGSNILKYVLVLWCGA